MNYGLLLNIFHIFIVSPALLAIGLMKSNTPNWAYTALLVTGLIVFAYHLYKFMIRVGHGSPYVWVNAIHVFLVAPVLIYVGYKQKDALRFSYELLLLLGFSSLGYHLFSMVRNIQTIERETH